MGLGSLFSHRVQRNYYTPLYGWFEKHLQSLSARKDPDRLLSYYTRQQLVIRNWKLGATYWVIHASLAAFLVGYVLIYHEGYVKYENAKGAVVTHVSGDALATSTGKTATRYFSTEELTYPGLENGNVFIATHQTVHRQMRGFCENPDMACTVDSDCNVIGGGTCNTEQGVCRVYSWCNVDDIPEIYEMQVDKVQIWARAAIQFLKLAPKRVISTDQQLDSDSGQDTVFTVRDLLDMVGPFPIHYEEVSTLGALFEVGIRWECNLGGHRKCKPELNARRLDVLFDPGNIGYGFSYSEYTDDGHRMHNRVTGLRFLFRTTGLGKKLSLSALVTTVSTSGTIMSLALIISDVLLTKVFHNRKHFNARKFEITPDFSDLMEQVVASRAGRQKLSDIEKAEAAIEEKEKTWQLKINEKSAKEFEREREDRI